MSLADNQETHWATSARGRVVYIRISWCHHPPLQSWKNSSRISAHSRLPFTREHDALLEDVPNQAAPESAAVAAGLVGADDEALVDELGQPTQDRTPISPHSEEQRASVKRAEQPRAVELAAASDISLGVALPMRMAVHIFGDGAAGVDVLFMG